MPRDLADLWAFIAGLDHASVMLSPFALANWSGPTGQEMILIAIMGASACCNFLVIAAFRFGEAMVLSRLSYLELTTATLFGILVFAEFLDAATSTGITFVVGGSLLIWISEWKRTKATIPLRLAFEYHGSPPLIRQSTRSPREASEFNTSAINAFFAARSSSIDLVWCASLSSLYRRNRPWSLRSASTKW